ncbi:hypothetical protein EAE99_006931 [Botrytis elliptica]|nr:hypothetical protein EAE99_006931 [Botrytis elliptica]
MDIQGKVYNPENKDFTTKLYRLCHDTPGLNLPNAFKLQIPVRSNISSKRLRFGLLIEEIVTTILASRCNWYMLLNGVAEDLIALKQIGHKFVIFGLNDCVPMSSFHKKRLQATKSEVHSLIQKVRSPLSRIASLSDTIFLKGAIAIVGASCRLPGANNLEELWELIANGTDCHQEVSKDRFDLYGSYRVSQSGNFVSERKFYENFIDDVRRFDNQFFGINPREAANMDPQQRMLLELSFEALDSSGYLSKHSREIGDKATGGNVNCFINASLVEYLDNTNTHSPIAYTSTGTIHTFFCGRLSYYYGWCGPSEIINTICLFLLVVINCTCKVIQASEYKMALAEGVNIITGINNFLDLGKASFLSYIG